VCVVRFIHQACLWMCVLFYFLFVCLHVCAYAFKSKVHCESAFAPGAFVRPFYCAPPVCVPDVIAVWRQNTKNNKEQVQHIHKIIIQIITQPTSTTNIQVHHFKTTFHILNTLSTYKYVTSKQHSCVQGSLQECLRARRFRASLLLHTTCVHS